MPPRLARFSAVTVPLLSAALPQFRARPVAQETVRISFHKCRRPSTTGQNHGTYLPRLRPVIEFRDANLIGRQATADVPALIVLLPPADGSVVIDACTGTPSRRFGRRENDASSNARRSSAWRSTAYSSGLEAIRDVMLRKRSDCRDHHTQLGTGSYERAALKPID